MPTAIMTEGRERNGRERKATEPEWTGRKEKKKKREKEVEDFSQSSSAY